MDRAACHGSEHPPPPPDRPLAARGTGRKPWHILGENGWRILTENLQWEHRLRAQPSLRQATEESLARGAAYLPRLCAILAEHGLPPDLALLPVVESGFWPTARGRSGERGLWQLRRATARRFGLVVNARRDDRLNPDPATRAAVRYLIFLHAHYGEWPL